MYTEVHAKYCNFTFTCQQEVNVQQLTINTRITTFEVSQTIDDQWMVDFLPQSSYKDYAFFPAQFVLKLKCECITVTVVICVSYLRYNSRKNLVHFGVSCIESLSPSMETFFHE